MKTKLSVIYDITKKCPWNCKICCMSATSGNDALIDELSLQDKLSLMDDLAKLNEFRDIHIDFSGGEIFTNMENLLVIEKASSLLGKEKIGISSSGFHMSDELAKCLSSCISDFEMTMDILPGQDYPLRPKDYTIAAANAIPHLQNFGIKVGIQTVLTHSNCNEKILKDIYQYLCMNKVDNWSILKFYPVGRGKNYNKEILNIQEENFAINFIKNLDQSNPSSQKPMIDFHYTMRGHEKYSAECRCVRKSIGILPNGTVTSCFWALDSTTNPIDSKYLLGSVKEHSLTEILNNEKSAYWINCSHKCELSIA